MATFRFDLVSPEKLLFAGEVTQVDLPGSEGDVGELRVVVNGGVAEVGPAGLTVLADLAVPQEEFDPVLLEGVIKDTEEELAEATDDWRRDKLSHKVDQLRALQAELR